MFRRIEYGPVYAACIIRESIGFSGLQKFLTHLSRRLKKLHASLLAENMSRRGRIVWWVYIFGIRFFWVEKVKISEIF